MGVFKKGEHWYIDYYVKRRRKRKKVGPSKRLAEQALSEVQTRIFKQEHLGVFDEKKVLFKDFAKTYLEYVKANKSAGMHRNEKAYLDLQLTPAFGDRYLFEITREAIERVKQTLSEGRTPATVNRYLASLKHLLRKAVDWGYLKANPAVGVRKLKEPPGRVRYLSPAEVAKLLEVASPALRPIVVVALHTGMRQSEIFGLRWQDVDLTHGTVTVRRGKNNERRVIPMNATLLETMRALKKEAEGPYVFAGRFEGHRKAAAKTFGKAVTEAKLTDFRFHDLRHTFASYMMMRGCDVKTLQTLMGHKDITMTLRYSHLSPSHLRDSVQRLDTIWTPAPSTSDSKSSQVVVGK